MKIKCFFSSIALLFLFQVNIKAQNSDTYSRNTDQDEEISREDAQELFYKWIQEQMGSDPQQTRFILEQLLPLYVYVAGNRVTPELRELSSFNVKEIFRTPVDGTYYGYGDSRNTYKPYGLSISEQIDAVDNGARLKRNGSYVWGMTVHDGKLYWSTNNNYMCIPGYSTIATSGDMSWTQQGLDNGCWECEYQKGARKGESVILSDGSAAYLGLYADINVPRIFCYDPQTGITEDITPQEGSDAYTTIRNCQGLRSAYAFDDLIFFGGPGLVGGTNKASSSSAFVVYDPKTHEYIGSSDLANVDGCKVTNVRRWVEHNGVLYCGVGLTDKDGVARGAVLRWYGSHDNPLEFRIVGWTSCEAAEIEFHNDHMYVGGWPVTVKNAQGAETYPYSEIYRGPVVPEEGLLPENATEWEPVWRFQDYWNKTSYVSSMCSYKGKLYWGMFGSTYAGYYGAKMTYGENIQTPQAMAHMLGNLSATTVWRLDDSQSDSVEIELLYGEEQVPYNKGTAEEPQWVFENNGMGLKPKWGRSGWGNPFTCYTWALCKYKDNLVFGTMDMSNMLDAAEGGSSATDREMISLVKSILGVDESEYGYELVVLSDPEIEPKYYTKNAFGNPAAYGVRNLAAIGDDLYIGTANPFNIDPNGGWQIMRLRDNKETGIAELAESKQANIMMRHNGSYVVFYTMNGEDINDITVTDLSGRQVQSQKVNANVAYVVLDDRKAGIYAVTINSESGSWNAKVIKK